MARRETVGESGLTGELRRFIAASLHVGRLHGGDRLPSIRRIARIFGVTSYAALQAYGCLEIDGLVERRERSGIYLASMERSFEMQLPETAAWVAHTLTEAWEHQLKPVQMPELVRRWTLEGRLRCACVEECADVRLSLCRELEHQFGLAAVPMESATGRPEGLAEADVLVTTVFHAAELRSAAEQLGKPVLVAPMNEQARDVIEQSLQQGELAVLCLDPRFGQRLRDSLPAELRPRLRAVCVDDAPAVAALDAAQPVFASVAAHQRLPRTDLRLVYPPSPSYSRDFAHNLVATLVQLHLASGRA
ncbi:MAG TPA: GntR family transcriptional regulator [Longimicrobiaceae bacterium]|nr:GntR family transcriptional regulator [Longimicrobiaceae bacterium]